MAENNENVSLTDVENESQMNAELSGTESKIMDELSHSTPVPIKKSEDNDTIKMMQLLLERNTMLCTSFSEQTVKLNKFDEKFDEVKDEIKKQNFNFNKQMNEMNARYENMQEQIIESIDQVFEKKNARVDDIINNFKINKVDDNCEIKVGVENSGGTDQVNENKDGQLTHKYDEVSKGESYDDIIKNSGDEVFEEIECNNGMLVYVDESERKWRESI